MKLSTKVMTVIPLFLLAGAASEYLNYHYQTVQTLEQAQDAATAQAMIVRESLVNMMINNARVDDDYLARINKVGDVQRLHIWIIRDSLHLRPEFLTEERLDRLGKRELQEQEKHSDEAFKVFSRGEALWSTRGELLEAIVPFKAEAKCQRCHYVQIGHVLGAAHMEISLLKASTALRDNAKRSTWIFLVFALIAIAIDAVIFWWFVSKPVQKLVHATEVLGTGNLDYVVQTGRSRDEFAKLAASFNDMRQRLKQAQEELIHKERLSMVGQMASSIIHDFRSPMGIIQLAIETLLRQGHVSQQKISETFDLVRSSIRRMKRMTQELLDFSRGETTLEVCDCDLEEFVNRIVTSLKTHLENRGIQFVIQQGYQGKSRFDPDRLERALMNVINNAEDAMPGGGVMRFETMRDDRMVEFRISDTGGEYLRRFKTEYFNRSSRLERGRVPDSVWLLQKRLSSNMVARFWFTASLARERPSESRFQSIYTKCHAADSFSHVSSLPMMHSQ